VESVEDALNGVRMHQAAMVRAMQAAFRDLLARLDPDTLERKFQPKDKGKGKLGGLLSRAAPAPDSYWEQYREIYEQLAAHNDDLLLRMVSPKFAAAYAAEVQYLESRRQKEKDDAK
jgi:predicted component of type VI protein secretion system